MKELKLIALDAEVSETDVATGVARFYNKGSKTIIKATSPFGYVLAYPGAVIAVSLVTGKEAWRGPDPAQNAIVAASSGLAYVLSKDNNFYALDAANGRERWKVGFARDNCDSMPVVRDGTVYVGGNVLVTPADANRAAGYYRFLFALDAGISQSLPIFSWRNTPEQ